MSLKMMGWLAHRCGSCPGRYELRPGHDHFAVLDNNSVIDYPLQEGKMLSVSVLYVMNCA